MYIFQGLLFDTQEGAIKEALIAFVTAGGTNTLTQALEYLDDGAIEETINEAIENDWFIGINDKITYDDVRSEVSVARREVLDLMQYEQ